MIGLGAMILLRTVPPLLRAGVESGNYKVYGSIIRDMGSGQIVGHLQETSGLINMASMAMANPTLAPFNLGSCLAANVQNEQIKSGLAVVTQQNEAIRASLDVVQQMQLANLALSGLGIAVSVAGTTLLMQRIDKLSADVAVMHKAVDRIARDVAMLRQDAVDRDLAQLRTIVTRVDDAWMPSGTDVEWREIAVTALEIANMFNLRIERLLENGDEASGAAAAIPFLALYTQASDLWVTARMAAGQDDMARAAAAQRAQVLSSLGAHFTANTISRGLLSQPSLPAGDPGWLAERKTRWLQAREQALRVRQREVSAASSVETLTALHESGIAGREWLSQARNEKDAPLLFLPGPGWKGDVERAVKTVQAVALPPPPPPETSKVRNWLKRWFG
jgi:hypothetical protein